ncbi:hypothetical protein OUZ56_006014 [Daphnia magna]|uniref:Uncharacterized protein n=1 Tax=Daphnia magna TaxID=35525 RepID=A0ABQ9YUE6_9CRUS|nr:hypothetical protein OUZ56_006014 [Daphnia magna]
MSVTERSRLRIFPYLTVTIEKALFASSFRIAQLSARPQQLNTPTLENFLRCRGLELRRRPDGNQSQRSTSFRWLIQNDTVLWRTFFGSLRPDPSLFLGMAK